MEKYITKREIGISILFILMLICFVVGFALIIADEYPKYTISLFKLILIKGSGFILFYCGTLLYKRVNWK